MDIIAQHRFLKSVGVICERGLETSEIRHIEECHEFLFPPDLRLFLEEGLPVSEGWVNWRQETEEEIKHRLEWPLEGICFDIEHNGFWLKSWGEMPERLAERFEIAREALRHVPKLIPIFSHRYIPDSPHESGNPVFSVHQTDIIYYGANLENYLRNEFMHTYDIPSPIRPIVFWGQFDWVE